MKSYKMLANESQLDDNSEEVEVEKLARGSYITQEMSVYYPGNASFIKSYKIAVMLLSWSIGSSYLEEMEYADACHLIADSLDNNRKSKNAENLAIVPYASREMVVYEPGSISRESYKAMIMLLAYYKAIMWGGAAMGATSEAMAISGVSYNSTSDTSSYSNIFLFPSGGLFLTESVFWVAGNDISDEISPVKSHCNTGLGKLGTTQSIFARTQQQVSSLVSKPLSSLPGRDKGASDVISPVMLNSPSR